MRSGITYAVQPGLPANIRGVGRYKVRPILHKQPEFVDVFTDDPEIKGIVRNGILPASPAHASVSRQVRRYITREFEKDRKPLSNNLVQVLRQRAIAERNAARLAAR